jgi:exodeoxyribonuclease-3
MRLATWNVNSVTARLPRLLDWLDTAAPDVLCLQETKTSVAAFPAAQVRELGYESAVAGQGRWNGVAVLSRVGLDDVVTSFDGQPTWDGGAAWDIGAAQGSSPAQDDDTAQGALFTHGGGILEARAVGATCAGLRVWSLYVPNGRELTHPHFAYKLAWLAAYRDATAAEVTAYRAFAACGDFNIAPTDADVWDIADFAGSTHVTEQERAALAALRDLGLHDVVPRPLKYDIPFTYWDYRAGMFHQNKGMRIDLVYANAAVAGAVRDAYVDRAARKGTGPSDHAPVVLDLEL